MTAKTQARETEFIRYKNYLIEIFHRQTTPPYKWGYSIYELLESAVGLTNPTKIDCIKATPLTHVGANDGFDALAQARELID